MRREAFEKVGFPKASKAASHRVFEIPAAVGVAVLPEAAKCDWFLWFDDQDFVDRRGGECFPDVKVLLPEIDKLVVVGRPDSFQEDLLHHPLPHLGRQQAEQSAVNRRGF